MNELTQIDIEIISKEPRTDSRLLSPFLGHRHRTILENLDKYQGQFKELGPLPTETEKGKPLPQGGFAKPSRYFYLNEDQCYFLLTLMRNNEHIVKCKLALVKAFRDARAQLASRDMERLKGKSVRKNETDAIKCLVEYASARGSQNASKYYTVITKMTNKFLGIDPGSREQMNKDELSKLTFVEHAIDMAIRDGIKADMPYKDIYALAKNRLESYIKPLIDHK